MDDEEDTMPASGARLDVSEREAKHTVEGGGVCHVRHVSARSGRKGGACLVDASARGDNNRAGASNVLSRRQTLDRNAHPGWLSPLGLHALTSSIVTL